MVGMGLLALGFVVATTTSRYFADIVFQVAGLLLIFLGLVIVLASELLVVT